MILILFCVGGSTAAAQEYLDTAGRWKRLVDPARAGTAGFARAIGCARGGVIISRDNGTLLASSDSGETFHDLRAEGTLDSTIRTVWAIAWPDTLGEPNRVVAVTSIVETGRRPYVRMIESSDGGFTWTNGPLLPSLDTVNGLAERMKDAGIGEPYMMYMAVHPPFVMKFIPRSGGGTVGFIATIGGLLASEDNGRSWQMRCDSIMFGALAMADENNGVAYSSLKTSSPARLAALHRTTDGGRSWEWVQALKTPYHFVTGLQAFGPATYRMLTPDMNSLAYEWNVVQSLDSGRSWRAQQYHGDNAALTMDNYWLDTSDLHLANAFADVRHSTDGGTRWHLLHPTEDPLPIQPGYRINLTAFDGTYIYYASNRNRIGRWRVARRVLLPVSVPGAQEEAVDAPLIYPNPVAGAELHLLVPERFGLEPGIEIIDLLGNTVARHSPGSLRSQRTVTIATVGLAAGRYTLRIVGNGCSSAAPLMIASRF
jgi:photosystem II stability/assembly factor-like uncharacterized protein